jgi:hypothetical protein
VTGAAFSPEGDRVLTVSEDGTARTWLVRLEDLRALADRRALRDFTPEEHAIYAPFLGN